MDTKKLMQMYGDQAFHPNGKMWTWMEIRMCHEHWGFSSVIRFPFLDSDEGLMIGDEAACVEDQLAAIEQGWA